MRADPPARCRLSHGSASPVIRYHPGGMQQGRFPEFRPRRLRRTAALRDAVADVHLPVSSLVMPLFVTEAAEPREVASMPGVSQLPVDHAVRTVRELVGRGLRQFIFFGVTPPRKKDPTGSHAVNPDNAVLRTVSELRQVGVEAVLWTDLCLCEYTDHGHCGTLEAGSGDGEAVVDNDATLLLLGRIAVAQARAGADVVAPSGMMDGQVQAIRGALDAAGFADTAICSYAVKYASGLYGPFREAGEGGMQFGDRRGYQMDFRRAREWRSELAADAAQGVDMVMVKPAHTYLDVIAGVRSACDLPVAAYHVSGEYSMLHAAAERGWLDVQAAAWEVTMAIRRAGADLILTYFAPKLLDWGLTE